MKNKWAPEEYSRKTLPRVVVFIVFALVAVASLLYVTIQHPIQEVINLRCVGQLKDKPTTTYLKIEKYRWLSSYWYWTNGKIHVEIPGVDSYTRGKIEDYGETIAVCTSDGVCGLLGYYDKQTRNIRLNSWEGSFVGNCRIVKQ